MEWVAHSLRMKVASAIDGMGIIFSQETFLQGGKTGGTGRGIRAKRRGGCHNIHAARGTLFLLPEGKDVGPVRDSPMRPRAHPPE